MTPIPSIVTRWLGCGLGFPIVPGESDRALRLVEGPEKVRQSILAILETEPGERVMRPAFGCGLRRFLMEPNNVATRALMAHDVELALGRWEPRIRLDGVDVLPSPDPSLVLVAVSYTHLVDGRPGNLVYPVYLA
jgi:phage baseplate assembly protein W